MGRAKTSTVSTVTSRKTVELQETKIDSYEAYKKEKLNILYLTDDASVREAAEYVKSLNVDKVSLDLETASKTGKFGSLNGTYDGSIRLMQLGFEPEGHEPFQIVLDCHSSIVAPFFPLLRNPKVEKQIHFMDFEQTWCMIHFGVQIKNIYDTCAANRVIEEKLYDIVEEHGLPAALEAAGKDWKPKKRAYNDNAEDKKLRKIMEEVGIPEAQKMSPGWLPGNSKLSTVAQNHLKITLPKEDQVSDWGKVKLGPNQIVYAAMDVAILPDTTAGVKKVAENLGVEDEIKQKINKKDKHLQNRVNTYKRHDDLTRISRALKRSKTKQEADSLFQASRQMTLKADNRRKLKILHQEIRSDLL